MATFTKSCLSDRMAQIDALIATGAIFVAAAALRGGQQCAALHSCNNWEECSRAHCIMRSRIQSAFSDHNQTH